MTNPHTTVTRITIEYESPGDFVAQAIAHGQQLGVVRGTGTIYDEGTRTPFTAWAVELTEEQETT